jgi:hypothetical protein
LKNNDDFLDEQVESLILEEKFSEKVEELINIFYESTQNIEDINLFKITTYNYEKNKNYFEKIINIIVKINSNKLISTEQNNKLFEIYNYFKNNDLIEKIDNNQIEKSIL